MNNFLSFLKVVNLVLFSINSLFSLRYQAKGIYGKATYFMVIALMQLVITLS